MKKALCPILILFSVAVPAFAQTQSELNEAAAKEYAVSDKAMNSAYQQLLKVLNEEGKKRLREAQRAWVTYRDAQAAYDSHHLAGGSAEPMERAGSLNLLTRERTQRLLDDYKRFREMNE